MNSCQGIALVLALQEEDDIHTLYEQEEDGVRDKRQREGLVMGTNLQLQDFRAQKP